MAVAAPPQPQQRQLLCLKMLGYMKSGLDEEDLCDFQVRQHAGMIKGLMEKYGVLRYAIVSGPQLHVSVI